METEIQKFLGATKQSKKVFMRSADGPSTHSSACPIQRLGKCEGILCNNTPDSVALQESSIRNKEDITPTNS